MSSSQKGFTLAEVLIALALLGVVAAFTIPKVLQSTGSGEKVAKLKETVATLEQVWYNDRLNGMMTAASFFANVTPELNTVNSNAADVTAAVASGGLGYTGSAASEGCSNALWSTGWVQFANGVIVTGMAEAPNVAATAPTARTNNVVMCIDTNGTGAPNTLGTDAFLLNFNQSGAFASTGTVNASAKNFFYGDTTNAANGAFDAAGTGRSGNVAQSVISIITQ